MNISKAVRRDNKRSKRNRGMQVDGRSVFVLEEQKRKKAELEQRRREKENSILAEIGT